MKVKQTQLLLIIENLNIPVNKDIKVYTSVMEAWTTALTTMDKLVDGINHSVHNGAVLLGLSAWHLYPDLIVLGKSTANTKQNDPLVVPSGVVTLGLQGAEPENSRGVYWSLPLANVRYYGDPIITEGSVNSDQSRITIDDVWLVTLGSLFALWGQDGANTKDAAELVCCMWEKCKEGLATPEHFVLRKVVCAGSWLKHLADAAQRYLQSSSHEQESCKRLVGLGRRRSNLLGQFSQSIPIFGLRDATFVNILKSEARVEYLRSIALKCGKDTDVFIIRVHRHAAAVGSNETTFLQLATAGTRRTPGVNGTYPDQVKDPQKRWTYEMTPERSAHARHKSGELLGIRDGEEFYTLGQDLVIPTRDDLGFRWINPPSMYLDDCNTPGKSRSMETSVLANKNPRWWNFFSRGARNPGPKASPVAAATFEFVYGDVHSAALFRRVNLEGVSFRRLFRENMDFNADVIRQRQVTDAFKFGIVDQDHFLKHLSSLSVGNAHPAANEIDFAVIEALRAGSTATKIYSYMPNATVALSVITCGPLCKAQ